VAASSYPRRAVQALRDGLVSPDEHRSPPSEQKVGDGKFAV